MYEWEFYKAQGWKKNPFVLAIGKEWGILWEENAFLVLANAIRSSHKTCIYSGDIGVGKTSFVNALKERFKKDKFVTENFLIDDAPVKHLLCYWSITDSDTVMKDLINCCGVWKYLPGKKDLDFLFERLEPTVVIFDESQDFVSGEAEIMKKLIRPLSDRAQNIRIVFMGLPNLLEKIVEGSIRERATEKRFPTPTQDEIRDIILTRLKTVSEKGEVSKKWLLVTEELIKETTPRKAIKKGFDFIEYLLREGIIDFTMEDYSTFTKVDTKTIIRTEEKKISTKKKPPVLKERGYDLSRVQKEIKGLNDNEKKIFEILLEGKQPLNTLIERAGAGRTTVYRALKKLEKRGILSEVVSAEDKRIKVFGLSSSFEGRIIAK
jgi:type II secretory pathway predicted ATPase ExeA/DNA-binding MarR family transcriptional regulator